MKYSPEDLTQFALGIAAKLKVSAASVTLTQGDKGLLTVKVLNQEFTGTIEQIWAWIDGLLKPRPNHKAKNGNGK